MLITLHLARVNNALLSVKNENGTSSRACRQRLVAILRRLLVHQGKVPCGDYQTDNQERQRDAEKRVGVFHGSTIIQALGEVLFQFGGGCVYTLSPNELNRVRMRLEFDRLAVP